MTALAVRTRLAFALAVAALTAPALDAQTSATRKHVETLASEPFGGRLTGSPGEKLAREYIASELQKIGAKPLPGQRDVLLPFQFTAGTRDGGSQVSIATKYRDEKRGVDGGSIGGRLGSARALSFSDNGDVSAPVVFAGYGIVVPEGQEIPYDSYAGLDVKDKVVLVLRYFPEEADQKTRSVLARYSDLRYKAQAARQRGAKALLVVTGPRSPNAGELVPMTFDTALAGSGIIAASITDAVAGDLFGAGTLDKTLESVQRELDSGNPHVAGFDFPNVSAQVRTRVQRETQTGYNVVAYLPATSDVSAKAKPWIALGAHYDHLGSGGNGLSLASKDEVGRTHYGADDNASGTAAVLAVAAALANQPRPRHVLFALWSGEELNLLGSGAFIAKPPVPLAELEAYLNFDMVGRMQENKLTVQASGTSEMWNKLLEQANITAGFDLRLQPDPYQPTDVLNFNTASVPSLNFFTGVHTDYHRPTDTADKIDFEDLDRIAAFATSLVRRLGDLVTPPAFVKVDSPSGGGVRAGVRIYTGTIPDYAGDVKGLLLSGVVGGGPAEQAGLRKGDVIVEIAGQSITNIYDYTYALDVLKIGEPAKVIYMRDGQRKDTTLTPTARK